MNTDLTLERILSLFPIDKNGKPVRGSSKELADYLGLSHNAVAEWKSGKSKSYMRYLHEIAAKYGVSVAWLKGETNEKSPLGNDAERALDEEIISRLCALTPEEIQRVDDFVQGLLAAR